MEVVNILKILQSRKAPLVKKRQAMRNTFGDYRAKMKKEQTKSAAGESPEIKLPCSNIIAILGNPGMTHSV